MELHDLYLKTRTIRKFEDVDVSDEDIRYILENARIASNTSNKQMLRYIVIKSKDKVKEMNGLVRFAGALPKEIGQPKDDEYPNVYIAIIQKAKAHGFIDIDTGIVCDRIMTSSREKGLGSIIFGSHNPLKVGEFLGIEEGEKARIIIGIGHPKITSALVELEDEKTAYYTDDDFNYYVPKRKLEDIVEEM